MRYLSDERIEELAASMEGSIHGVEYFLEDGEDMSHEDEIELYHLVDVCDTCGWNFSRDDLNSTDYGELLCWRCEEDAAEEE